MGAENANKQIVILESMNPVKDTVEQFLEAAQNSAQPNLLNENASQPHKATVNSVKRNLFGKVDHAEFMAFVEYENTKLMEKIKYKYGFDFEEEKPIAGSKLKWKMVSPYDFLRHKTSTTAKVTKVNISCNCKSSALITSYLPKCKTVNRRNTFTKSLTEFRKLVRNTEMERIQ